MKSYIIEKNKLENLLDYFLEKYKVYGPIKSGADSKFDEIKSINDLHLDYSSTILPPKKFFHPSRQILFKFSIQKEKYLIQEDIEYEKFILFGVHPCDVYAILKLDKFFSGEFKDSFYQNRRKNSIIVALNCNQPGENSFCKSMNAGPFLKEGYDILLTDIDTKYLIEIGSNKGKKLIESLGLAVATNRDIAEKEKKCKISDRKIKKILDPSWLPKLAEENLDHEIWIDLGERGGVADSFPCLSCGSCSLVCPTCYCYDIYDTLDLSLKHGSRIRELDSCQLLEYGEVALGGNFRKERKDRIRHWMFCKFGAAAGGKNSNCVGCGRCIRVCPSKIDITKVAKELRRRK
jgi:ferredoxin